MKKDVLISIKPKWCELIASGRKTIEVRKTRPYLKPPFYCYIYSSKPIKKVIGEFVCDDIKQYLSAEGDYPIHANVIEQTALMYDDIVKYGNGKPLYFWHISNLKMYEENEFKNVSEFLVADKEKDKNCKYKVKCYQNPDYTNGALLNGGSYCTCKRDFCYGCNMKWLQRPPQSWCYASNSIMKLLNINFGLSNALSNSFKNAINNAKTGNSKQNMFDKVGYFPFTNSYSK